QLARQRGEAAQAEALARRAAELFGAIGAVPGPERPGAGPPRQAPAGLSPRELDVVRLVAQGRTNREVAAALVISEQTAINHLTHVFDKLCRVLHRDDECPREGTCVNRTTVAAFAIHQGLA